MDNYKSFINNVARLVVDDFKGSLKAEHGTGRNMAPFVEYEWGGEIYQLMKLLKKALDPQGILNPGVLINDDAEVKIIFFISFFLQDSNTLSNPIIFTFALSIVSSSEETRECAARSITTSTSFTI